MVDWIESVPPSVLEPHFRSDAAQLARNLTRLSRTEALVLCAKLNLLTSDGASQKAVTGHVAALKLLQADGVLPAKWYENLRVYLDGKAAKHEPAYVVNRPALLELMRWIATCCTENKSASDLRLPHVGKAFVSSLLMCSEFYGAREIAPTLEESGAIEDRRFAFLPGLRRAATWAGAFVDPLVALGRAQLILVDEYFAKHKEYQKVFEDTVGISIDDYMTCATGIVLGGFINDKQKVQLQTLAGCFELGVNTVFSKTANMQPKFETYLSRVAQTADELCTALGGTQNVDPSNPFDFRPFRNKPVLRFYNEAIVLDQRLFVESYSAGPIFVLTRALKSEEPLKKYGVACQDYAFRLLTRTDGRHKDKNKALHLINEPTGDKRPINDIALASPGGVILFEAKGAWLNDDVLYQTDPDAFWSEVLKKYGVSIDTKTKEEKRKGIAQLADVIEGLASGGLKGVASADFINQGTTFIPALVMQDSLMTEGSLFPHQLAIDFNKLMGQSAQLPTAGHFQFGRFTVHTLVPLTLHDLEALETVDPTVSIFNLFVEYSREVPERGDSFTAFLNNRQPQLKRLPNDQLLLRQASAALLGRIRDQHSAQATTALV